MPLPVIPQARFDQWEEDQQREHAASYDQPSTAGPDLGGDARPAPVPNATPDMGMGQMDPIPTVPNDQPQVTPRMGEPISVPPPPTDNPFVVGAQSVPPQAPAPAQLPPIDKSSPDAFIASVTPYAQQVQAETGIPASIMVGIAANETGYGRYSGGNNFFGIKGQNPNTGASFNSPTWEVYNGQRVNITDTFRSYDNPADSFRDFARFLADNPRYANALKQTSDPAAFIRAVHAAGYATDPNWSSQVLAIAGRTGLPSGGGEFRSPGPGVASQPSSPMGGAQTLPSSVGSGGPPPPPAVPYVPSPMQQQVSAGVAPYRDRLAAWSGREGGYQAPPTYSDVPAAPRTVLQAPSYSDTPPSTPPPPPPTDPFVPEPAPAMGATAYGLQNDPTLGQSSYDQPYTGPSALGAASYDQPTSVSGPPPGFVPPPPPSPPESSPLQRVGDAFSRGVQQIPGVGPVVRNFQQGSAALRDVTPASIVTRNLAGEEQIANESRAEYDALQTAIRAYGPDSPQAYAAQTVYNNKTAALRAEGVYNVAERNPSLAPAELSTNIAAGAVAGWVAPGAEAGVARNIAGVLIDPGTVGLNLAADAARAGQATGQLWTAEQRAQAARQAAQQAFDESIRQFDDLGRAQEAARQAEEAVRAGRQWGPPRPPGRNEPVQALPSGPPPANSYLDQLPGDVAGSQRGISAPQTQPALPGARPAPLDQPIPLRGAPAGWTPDVIEQGGRPTFPELPPGNAETRMRVRLEDAARSLEREAEHAMELGDTNKEIALRREAATARQAAAHPSAPPTPDTGAGIPRDPVGSPYDLSPYNDQLQHLAGLAPTDGVPGQFAQRRGATSFHLDPNYREDIPAAQMQWDRLNDADRAAMPYLDPNGPQGGYKYPPITDRGLPPGTSNLASGFAAAGFSQEGTDENTTPEDRAKRAALGLGIGLLGRKVLGKVGPEAAAQASRAGFGANVRLSKYPEEVQNLIRSAAAAHPEQMQTARRGVLSDQVVQDLSRYSGVDADRIVRTWQPGKTQNAESLLAIREALAQQATRVITAQKAYREGAVNRSPETLTNLAQEIARHRALQEVVSGTTAEAGRALRQFRQGVTGEGAAEAQLNQIMKTMYKHGRKEDIAEFLGKVDMSNPVEVANAVRTLYQPSLHDKWTWYWYNSMLSSPVGRVRDIVSSGLNTLGAPLETAAAVPFDMAASALRGTPRTLRMAEVPAEYRGMAAGLGDAWRDAAQVLEHGFTAGQARADLEVASREAVKGPFGGKLLNAPTRVTAANDVFWRTANARASIYAQAEVIARQEKLKGDALTQRIANLRRNPSDAMVEEATKVGKYRVWQNDGALVDAVANLKRRVPALTAIIPFTQTPINLMKYALERSPLGFIGTGIAAKRGAGQREISQGLARASLGSALFAGAYQMAQQGLITGAAPKAPAERDAFYRQGMQPYAVKLGDQWHSYQGAAHAPVLAGAVEALKLRQKGDDDSAAAMASTMVLGMVHAGVDQPFMQGLSQAIQAIDDPQRYGPNYIEHWATSPIPQVIQFAARASDKIIRDPDGPIEAAMSVLPGLNQNVPPKLDAFGNTVTRPDTQQGIAALNPLRPSPEKVDVVETELARLQAKGFKVEPGIVPGNVQVGQEPGPTENVRLERGERSDYQRGAGQMAYGYLAVTMADPGWAAVPDEQKAKYIDDVVRGARKVVKEQQIIPQVGPRANEQYFRNQQKRAAGE